MWKVQYLKTNGFMCLLQENDDELIITDGQYLSYY